MNTDELRKFKFSQYGKAELFRAGDLQNSPPVAPDTP